MRLTIPASAAIALFLNAPALAGDATCFASSAAYAAGTYGNAFAEDENIVVSKKRYGRVTFDVVEDRTSGTNHPRTLLLPRAGQGYCVVLATPPVAQLDASAIDAHGMPLRFTATEQVPPGLPAHAIRYGWRPSAMRYQRYQPVESPGPTAK